MSDYLHTEWLLSGEEVFPRRKLFGFDLAPNCESIAFVAQHDERSYICSQNAISSIQLVPNADIYLMPAQGGYPQPLTSWADQAYPPVWSPNGEWLATEHDNSLTIVPSDGTAPKILYSGQLYHPTLDHGDARFGLPQWSPDGHVLAFAALDGDTIRLLAVSRDGNTRKVLYTADGHIVSWNWSPSGRSLLLVTEAKDSTSGAILQIDLRTGNIRQLSVESDYRYRKPLALWAQSSRLAILRSNRSGWSKLWLASLPSGEVRPLTQGDWDDLAFRLSPDGAQLVYASRAGQSGSGDDLWVMQLRGGQPVRITSHPGTNVPVAWSHVNGIYYWHSSPTEPGDLWRVLPSGGTPKRLTWSAATRMERKLNAPNEAWIASDKGVRVPVLVYQPVFFKRGDRYPAIVWIHGGPTSASRFEYAPFYNWLANYGFIVVVPNYRGSTGYGVAYMREVIGEGLGKTDLSDVLAAGEYARTLPQVDASRGVGVGGRSWGGYLTLMAVTQTSNVFSCGVAGAAISEWYIQQSNTEARGYDHWLIGGWVYEHAERYLQRSPAHFVNQIRVPLLVYHGEEDRDVPFEQSRLFADRARMAGVEIEYVTYSKEGHSTLLTQNQQDVLDRTVAFYRRHLQSWNYYDNPPQVGR